MPWPTWALGHTIASGVAPRAPIRLKLQDMAALGCVRQGQEVWRRSYRERLRQVRPLQIRD